MSVVRDDPIRPDPGFAELYANLPDATDLWPWLELARAATPPVLYRLVGVDSHPGMLERLRQRLPNTELIQSRIEDLDLGRRFSLVMVPSNLLETVERLRHAAAHVAPAGLLAAELTNPYWLRAGASAGVRVQSFDGNGARFEVDYTLPDGRTVTQRAEITLVWPEEVETWLAAGAGLRLRRMFGLKEAELTSSPSFYVVAERVDAGGFA